MSVPGNCGCSTAIMAYWRAPRQNPSATKACPRNLAVAGSWQWLAEYEFCNAQKHSLVPGCIKIMLWITRIYSLFGDALNGAAFSNFLLAICWHSRLPPAVPAHHFKLTTVYSCNKWPTHQNPFEMSDFMVFGVYTTCSIALGLRNPKLYTKPNACLDLSVAQGTEILLVLTVPCWVKSSGNHRESSHKKMEQLSDL